MRWKTGQSGNPDGLPKQICRTPKEFWAQVEVDPRGECWTWQRKLVKGYGQLRWRGRHEGAHRVAYELINGPIPPGMLVLHTCDNRACCNPQHLWVGTQSLNILDAVAKGRHVGNLRKERKL